MRVPFCFITNAVLPRTESSVFFRMFALYVQHISTLEWHMLYQSGMYVHTTDLSTLKSLLVLIIMFCILSHTFRRCKSQASRSQEIYLLYSYTTCHTGVKSKDGTAATSENSIQSISPRQASTVLCARD